ncbi:TRMT1-like protein isoform X1 [Haliotis asinina]|uniref:TRMT1-like protein isoform X1 n=1 Tax=Haliotis asinina TaxID=109174 RepID=UPI0035324777
MAASEKWITERGISFRNDYGETPLGKSKLHNPKLLIFRELILVTVSELSWTKETPLYAVDTSSGSGVAGMQWKKHLADQVHVTITDSSPINCVKHNCSKNDFQVSTLTPDLCRPPGLPLEGQDDNTLHVCQALPHVLLQMEAFDFVYLDPHKNSTSYFRPVFANIKNNGVVSLVVPNVSGFSRTPHIVLRNYSAHVIKTDYTKEMAARIVTACMARSAASCNKGIEVLFCASFEDFLLVTVRVLRGPGHADVSVRLVRHLLHCQICEERQFYPDQKAPLEDPYSLLPCDCHVTSPGKTAVVLGPMWCGDIFNTDFLKRMARQTDSLNISVKTKSLLSALIEESHCYRLKGEQCVIASSEMAVEDSVLQQDNGTENDNIDEGLNNSKVSSQSRKRECAAECDRQTKKMKAGKADEEKDITKGRSLSNSASKGRQPDICPPFYCSTLQRKKYRDITVPKIDRMVTLLRSSGYRASRTHFDAVAIRTDANLKQIYTVLKQHCSK